MCIAFSITTATFYALFFFGYMGSSREKHCLANPIEYEPLMYEKQIEMGNYLKKDGTEDVTRKFDTVIFLGLVSNLIYIWFSLYK